MTPDPQPIIARLSPLAFEEGKPPPQEIMAFPAGTHTIHASQGGKPVTKTVIIDEQTAAVFQAVLAAQLKEPQKPYFDFDHDDTQASAWPKSCRWEPGTSTKPAGVYITVEWSASGSAAVTGKNYRSFSPAFFTDKSTPARIIGAPRNMGGLVNDPAFEKQAPIWAARYSQATSPEQNQQQNNTMKTPEQLAADAAQQAEAVRAQAQKDAAAHAEAIKAKNAENEALQAKLKTHEDAAAIRAKADAKARVDAAVKAGKLPPKDEALHAKWTARIVADPSQAELLDALPANPILAAITQPGGMVTVSDGLVESLRAYNAEKNPDARGAIYAKKIAPEFKGDFSLGPILAANELGSLSADLILQRAFSLLKANYAFLKDITTDFSGENAAFNQTIVTRLKTPLQAQNYVPGVGYGKADVKTPNVRIPLDQHIGVSIEFNVNELASTSRDLFGEQAEGMYSAIGDSLMNALYALITAGNFAKVSEFALADFGRPAMASLAKELNKSLVSKMGRFALLNPDFFEQLSKDATIVQLAANQKADLITEYLLPRVSGFQPYEAVTLPVAGALAGFVGTSESLALATRPANDYTKNIPGAGGGNISIVTSADLGIAMQLVQYVDHKTATASARAALMFGAAVGNPATGRRITLKP